MCTHDSTWNKSFWKMTATEFFQVLVKDYPPPIEHLWVQVTLHELSLYHTLLEKFKHSYSVSSYSLHLSYLIISNTNRCTMLKNIMGIKNQVGRSGTLWPMMLPLNTLMMHVLLCSVILESQSLCNFKVWFSNFKVWSEISKGALKKSHIACLIQHSSNSTFSMDPKMAIADHSTTHSLHTLAPVRRDPNYHYFLFCLPLGLCTISSAHRAVHWRVAPSGAC